MKKHKKFLAIIVAAVLICGAGAYILSNKPGGNVYSETDARTLLTDHYEPRTCYGMPPETGVPSINLADTSEGWEYEVADGNCCEITYYEGTVTKNGGRITETKTRTENVPC